MQTQTAQMDFSNMTSFQTYSTPSMVQPNNTFMNMNTGMNMGMNVNGNGNANIHINGNHRLRTAAHMAAPVPSQSTSLATAIANSTELFVGNLSYFCQDQHLFDLFNSYGHVESVRTISADNGTRPLMFGFVRLSSVAEAQEMRTLLDNHLFMGRRIK